MTTPNNESKCHCSKLAFREEQRKEAYADRLKLQEDLENWKAEAAYLKSHRDEIKKLLIEAIKLLRLPHSMCQVSHHSKEDRHELGDKCPIDRRVEELLEKYDDLVYNRKKP